MYKVSSTNYRTCMYWLLTIALTMFNVTVQVSVALVLLRTVKIGIFSLVVHQGRHLESSISSASTGIESNDLWLRWPSGNFHEVIGTLSMIFPKKFTAEEIWTISQQHWTSKTKNWDVLHNIFICVAKIKKENHSGFGVTWRWVHNDRIFIWGWTVPLGYKQTTSPLQCKPACRKPPSGWKVSSL